jgi:hypothetical protein
MRPAILLARFFSVSFFEFCCQKFNRLATLYLFIIILFYRVELQVSAHKALACCLMFPADYPHAAILIELKSLSIIILFCLQSGAAGFGPQGAGLLPHVPRGLFPRRHSH